MSYSATTTVSISELTATVVALTEQSSAHLVAAKAARTAVNDAYFTDVDQTYVCQVLAPAANDAEGVANRTLRALEAAREALAEAERALKAAQAAREAATSSRPY